MSDVNQHTRYDENSLRIEPLTPTIGAEIHGVDLSQALSDAQIKAIRRALLEHLVVIFRDQQLDPRSLEAFGRHFGEPHVHFAEPDGVDGVKGILRVHADADSTFNNGGGWHSDASFDEEPPMGSILHLHTAPESGGDTLFANMYAAYDALSEPMKAFLGGLTARHDSGPRFRSHLRADDLRGGVFNAATHPVVRTHPETGKKAMYVSPYYFTTHIVELEPAESEVLLGLLSRHIDQPHFHCRFRWQLNSVAFWDNRAAQHQALWDYYPATRTGNRYTIGGDRPIS